MTPIYNIDYFISKFEAIPDKLWTTKVFTTTENGVTKRCALGHCESLKEALDLVIFSYKYLHAYIDMINDGMDNKYQQATAKDRVLAALNDMKKGEG